MCNSEGTVALLVTVALYHRLQCPLLTGPCIFATCLDADWRRNVFLFYATKPNYDILDLVCFHYHIETNSISGALML